MNRRHRTFVRPNVLGAGCHGNLDTLVEIGVEQRDRLVVEAVRDFPERHAELILVARKLGKGAADSVTDSFGQTHEITNLWIAGPGIFPTSGAPNPTYTILALSLRGAENLAKNWGTVAG